MIRGVSAILLLSLLSAARAEGAPPASAAPEDLQVALDEANYQISALSSRAQVLAVSVGRDNREIVRLNGELAKAKAEVKRLTDEAAKVKSPTPPVPAAADPAQPTEPPK